MPEAKTKTFCWLFPLSPPATPTPPCSPTLAPGWKPSLHLSYCFKPKFTVSVGGPDPLSTLPPPYPPRTLGLSRGWGPCSPPLYSWPARRKARGRKEGGALPSAPQGVPLSSGSGPQALVPTLGFFLGALQTPRKDQVPHHAGSVDSSRGAGKKKRKTPQTPYGGPQLGPRTGCVGCS